MRLIIGSNKSGTVVTDIWDLQDFKPPDLVRYLLTLMNNWMIQPSHILRSLKDPPEMKDNY